MPLAFLLSYIAPWMIGPILVLGGVYLSFEGVEVIYHYIHSKISSPEHSEQKKKTLTEEQKIKSAIITDFILSIEIVVVALGSVVSNPFVVQLIVVSLIAVLATIGVYGIVALLVRMDDMGYYIIGKSKDGSLMERFGAILVKSLPKIIKILSFVGTIAMLLVAGNLITHHLEVVHNIYNIYFDFTDVMVFDLIISLVIGSIVFLIYLWVNSILKRQKL